MPWTIDVKTWTIDVKIPASIECPDDLRLLERKISGRVLNGFFFVFLPSAEVTFLIELKIVFDVHLLGMYTNVGQSH